MPQWALKAWEDFHPLAFGAITSALLLRFSNEIATLDARWSWNIAGTYGAIFGLAGVYTAFLFTFYSFVATTDRGFIGRLRPTETYRRIIRFTVISLILGASVIVCTLPLILFEPTLGTRWGAWTLSIWAGITVWSTLAFVRAAYLFVIIASGQKA